jgi:hypothetical protein
MVLSSDRLRPQDYRPEVLSSAQASAMMDLQKDMWWPHAKGVTLGPRFALCQPRIATTTSAPRLLKLLPRCSA